MGSSPIVRTNWLDARLAQLAEQPPCKRQVVGSIPTAGTNVSKFADVVELADTPARGAGRASGAGSSPAVGTRVRFSE
jgi:hypothetical protein